MCGGARRCAGACRRCIWKVYPRVCGGAVLATILRKQPRQNRSIPACAGEPRTRPPGCEPSALGLSPRVRGSLHTIHDTGLRTAIGLSPRVRGSHPLNRYVEILQGSIPACAGEPLPSANNSYGLSGLSPRVRGARTASGSRYPVPGLSPRVRGSHNHRPNHPDRTGSIPACAGEPPAASSQRAASWV